MREAVQNLSDCLYVAAEAIGPGAQKALEREGVLPLEVQEIPIEEAVRQIHKYQVNKERASVKY
jgi:predicted Fe-Mo cluster-binding NifX family protein